MEPSQKALPTNDGNLFQLLLDRDFSITLHVDAILVLIILLAVAIFFTGRAFLGGRWGVRRFEIETAELGLGGQKLTLRPNNTDRQIAYQIWVELSTRKIGLDIELEDDVIVEIYNSWHEFFSVTRSLIKDVPVSRFRRKDTEKIIKLSIEVLNIGLRPHLTKWQARFRRWYENALEAEGNRDFSPQDLQKKHPRYSEMANDLIDVNGRLIKYRERMYELITRL